MTSIYISKGNKILLLYRQGSRVVNNLWIGSAGGHFEEYELNSPQHCVLRELKEEINIEENQIENLSLRYITLRRTADEIRQNYYYFATLKDDIDEDIISNEGDLEWFDYTEIKDLPMPFTAKYVMKHYLEVGKENDFIYCGIADGEKVIFTSMPKF